MDKRFHHYYERELRYIRELGGEFSRRFPKVAGRLGIQGTSSEDPHVERLFQGFSWFAARVHQNLDAEFPVLTQGLLAEIYPHYLAPTPSMTVVQFAPDPHDGALGDGFLVPRGTELRARTQSRTATPCEYRTAHDVELWPISVERVEYTSVLHDIADLRIPTRDPIQALIRITLRTTGGKRFNQLNLCRMPLYLPGADKRCARLYEAMIAHAGLLMLRWGPSPSEHVAMTTATRSVRPLGFDAEHALLPTVSQGFQGYRLLQEYFAFPTRFHFVELCGLEAGIARCTTDRLELLLPLRRFDATLENAVDTSHLVPFATPAINLFQRTCDPIGLSRHSPELLLEPDRACPLDFEVHSVTRVATSDGDTLSEREVLPLAVRSRVEMDGSAVHYTLERRPRMVAYDEQRPGQRTAYPGSDLFLTLRAPQAGALPTAQRQLAVEALCTNRDLPLLLASHPNEVTFRTHSGAPASEVRCLAVPTPPRFTQLDGDTAWRLISHLSLQYLSLCKEKTGGAAALREMLELYGKLGDPRLQREIVGIRDVDTAPIVRPLPRPGPREFVRGLEVRLDCEEQAFSSHSAFTLASVLSVFFAKYVSVHSLTETVLHTSERGEVYRWPAQRGLQHVL